MTSLSSSSPTLALVPNFGVRTTLPTVRLRDVRLHVLTQGEAVDHILTALDRGRGGWVITPNLDHLRRAEEDETFAEWLRRADLVVADGMPLVWASRLQGTPLPERVPGSTLVETLAEAAALRGRSLFLLGGAPGAAEGAASRLQQQVPDLRIAGAYCPPLGFERDPQELARMEAAVTAAAPDLVYVALGSPKQEWVIQQLRPKLPHTWLLGVGISLSFLAGDIRRAPEWVQRIGLEWAHRLAQEPRRLGRRYLVDGLPFALRLFTGAVVHRCKRRDEAMNSPDG